MILEVIAGAAAASVGADDDGVNAPASANSRFLYLCVFSAAKVFEFVPKTLE
jgi:hypothetical protein